MSVSLGFVTGGNAVLHQVRWPERQNPARLNWNFFAGLWIATNTGRFIADAKGAKRRDFDLFTFDQRVGHMFEHALDQLRTFVP